jgi:putative SOS response-associated peptidase YedK
MSTIRLPAKQAHVNKLLHKAAQRRPPYNQRRCGWCNSQPYQSKNRCQYEDHRHDFTPAYRYPIHSRTATQSLCWLTSLSQRPMLCEFSQRASLSSYATGLGCTISEQHSELVRTHNINRPHALPSDRHWLLQLQSPNVVIGSMVKWCWLPGAGREKGETPSIVAERDKLMDKYFSGVIKSGRFLVPIDHWTEVYPPDSNPQLRHRIAYRNKRPMYLAALSNHVIGDPNAERDGFVIVIGNSTKFEEKKLARPILLEGDAALNWMDKKFKYQDAIRIVQDCDVFSDKLSATSI